MKYTKLGAFEELVMLMIGVLDDEAYGVAIKEEITLKTGKRPSIGALHSALSRLEKKGFISSYEGGATKERGGRRKRYYQLTLDGKSALQASYHLRNDLYRQIKGLAWD